MKFKLGQEVKFNMPGDIVSSGYILGAFQTDIGEDVYRIHKGNPMLSDPDSFSSDHLYIRSEDHLERLNECSPEKKRLWKFHWDCGRNGSLEGLFCATRNEVKSKIGSHCRFGEVLGKHSNIYGILDEEDVELVESVNSETIDVICGVLGKTWSGFNPMHYCLVECRVCGCEVHQDELMDGLCGSCEDPNSGSFDAITNGGNIDA